MAKSTNPHDKIFALLGLASDGDLYVRSPDYNDSIERLCRLVTLGAIMRRGILDVVPLLGRGCDIGANGSSSWVPDWHALDGIKFERQLIYLTGGNDMRVPGRSGIHCASSELKARAFHQNGVLTCQGIFIGQIEKAGFSIDEIGLPQNVHFAGSSDLPNPYGTQEETFKAIYYVLTNLVDRGWYLFDFLSALLRIWRSSYDAGFDTETQNWINSHRSVMIHGRTMESWAKWMSWTAQGVFARHYSARRRKHGRLIFEKQYVVPHLARQIQEGVRLMFTNTGHIGWARARGRVGDHLFILRGSSVPVILRPKVGGRGFLVVGDAFIHGYMTGKAVENVADDAWIDVELH